MPEHHANWVATDRTCGVFQREHRPEDRRADSWWMVELLVHPTPEFAADLTERGVLGG